MSVGQCCDGCDWDEWVHDEGVFWSRTCANCGDVEFVEVTE